MASSISITRTALGNFFIEQEKDGQRTVIFLHKHETDEIAAELTADHVRGTPEQVIFSRSYGN